MFCEKKCQFTERCNPQSFPVKLLKPLSFFFFLLFFFVQSPPAAKDKRKPLSLRCSSLFGGGGVATLDCCDEQKPKTPSTGKQRPAWWLRVKFCEYANETTRRYKGSIDRHFPRFFFLSLYFCDKVNSVVVTQKAIF